jgi:predicted RNase H-like HicB family nuclease
MEKYKINDGDLILDVIVTQEKIDDKTFFVTQGIQIDVASQGLSLGEALENFKDAAKMVLENSEDKLRIIRDEKKDTPPLLTRVFL